MYLLTNRHYGAFYTGATSNLIGRMIQHREGTFDGHAKRHGIKRLVYFEVADTMEAAIHREKQVKRYWCEWKRNLIERENPWWHDLAVGLGLEPLDEPPSGAANPGTGPG